MLVRQADMQPHLFVVRLQHRALVLLTDYSAILQYVTGLDPLEPVPVDVWSSPFERWETHMSGEPYAVAPWYSVLLVRPRGEIRTPGAGRRITLLQRQSFTRWLKELSDGSDCDE